MAKHRNPERGQPGEPLPSPAALVRAPPLVEKRSSAIKPPRSDRPGAKITGDEDTLASVPPTPVVGPPAPAAKKPKKDSRKMPINNDHLKLLVDLIRRQDATPQTLSAAQMNCERVKGELEQKLEKLQTDLKLEDLMKHVMKMHKEGKPLKGLHETVFLLLQLRRLIETKGPQIKEKLRKARRDSVVPKPQEPRPEPIPLTSPKAPVRQAPGSTGGPGNILRSLGMPGKLSLIGAGVFSAAMHATGSFEDLRIGIGKALEGFDAHLTAPEAMLSYYSILGGVILTTGAAWLLQARRANKRSALMDKLEARHPNEYRIALGILSKIADMTSGLPKDRQAQEQYRLLEGQLVGNEVLFVSMETLLGTLVTDEGGKRINGATIVMENAGLNIPVIRVLVPLLERAEMKIMGSKLKELREHHWNPDYLRMGKLKELFTDPKKPVFRRKMAALLEKDGSGNYVNAPLRQKYDKMNIGGRYAGEILQEIEGPYEQMLRELDSG